MPFTHVVKYFKPVAETVTNAQYATGNVSTIASYALWGLSKGVEMSIRTVGACGFSWGVVDAQILFKNKHFGCGIVSSIGACLDAYTFFSANATYALPLSMGCKIYAERVIKGALFTVILP